MLFASEGAKDQLYGQSAAEQHISWPTNNEWYCFLFLEIDSTTNEFVMTDDLKMCIMWAYVQHLHACKIYMYIYIYLIGIYIYIYNVWPVSVHTVSLILCSHRKPIHQFWSINYGHNQI